ncbi:MAG: LON peptidase substrate-binding domain-containing protein [Verrucomicrobiales bacterium]
MVIPEKLPIMALPGTCLFPGGRIPLHIFESKYRDMLHDVLSGDRMFCIGNLEQSGTELDDNNNISPFTTAGLLRACVLNHDGTANLILEGVKRVKILSIENNKPYKVGKVQIVETTVNNYERVQSDSDKLKSILKRNYFDYSNSDQEMQLNQILQNLNSPEDTINFAAQHFITHQAILQKLLSLASLDDQFDLIVNVLDK